MATPGRINPETGEPEKGSPDVGEPPNKTLENGDEPFPSDPLAPEQSE